MSIRDDGEVGGRNISRRSLFAVVVRGYVAMSQIYVMDPEFGFTTAAKFGSSYAYTSAYSGAMLRISEVVRRL